MSMWLPLIVDTTVAPALEGVGDTTKGAIQIIRNDSDRRGEGRVGCYGTCCLRCFGDANEGAASTATTAEAKSEDAIDAPTTFANLTKRTLMIEKMVEWVTATLQRSQLLGWQLALRTTHNSHNDVFELKRLQLQK